MASRRIAGVIVAAVMCVHGLAGAQTAREERVVSGFDQIVWRAVGELRITQGSKEGLVIEAEPRLLPKVIAEVKAGVLDIHFAEGQFSTRQPIRFHVSVKGLKRLVASGSGDIVLEQLDTPSFSLDLTGSGDMQIGKLATSQFVAKLAGSGDVQIGGGHAASQTIDLRGSGTYDAVALSTEDSTVSIGGSGDVKVAASRKLVAQIAGSGSVQYLGSPRVVESIAGSGKVSKLRPN
jgi:hypothetical protein